MGRAIVNTPVKGFTGVVVGVSFVDGTADVDNEAALAYFHRHGYEVIYAPAEAKTVEIPEGAPSTDWKADQLKAYAEKHDVDLGSAKAKPEIVKTIEEAAAAKAAAAENPPA